MSLQKIWTCFKGFGQLTRSSEEIHLEAKSEVVQSGVWQASIDQIINEVLLTEVDKLQATFNQHLREYEVALSQLRPENGHSRTWARQDVELLRQQVNLMERQRRQRNLEVGKLRKAMKEVRNALFTESPAEAQGHLAAKQLLDEVRTERERRLAEKHYLEDQIKKLKNEIKELEEQQTATPALDHEKEKLKASVRQLKMSIESKDRYACWVCNRAHERQEESGDGSETGEDSDHHDECAMMRRRLLEMEEEIRELTGEQGAASSVHQPASRTQPGARLSLEPPSVMESLLSPASTLRSARDRVPTPWAQASSAGGEASVQFSDSVTAVTSLEIPENVPEVGNRSVRDRIATPYVDSTTADSSEERRVLLAPALSTVEEFEAESSREQLRSSRDRMPTPHVSSEVIEETFASSGKTVRIFPAADMEAIPATGKRRPSRERQATPFVKEEDVPASDARTVQFNGAVSTEAIPATGKRRPSRERQATPFVKEEDVPASDARTVHFNGAVSTEAIPASGKRRPSRERQATPFVKEDMPASDERTVQFNGAVSTEAIPATGNGRPSRERQATPFVQEEDVPASDARTVQFNGAVSTELSGQFAELPESVPEVGKRSVRDRIATPFAPAASADLEVRRVLLAPVATTVEEFEVRGSVEQLRSSRDRMPTPHVSSNEETSNKRTVRLLPAAEIEAISASGAGRSSRDRQATPFVKDWPEDPRTVQFNDIVGMEDGAGVPQECVRQGLQEPLRPIRDRIPTPHVSAEMVEEAFNNSGKSVRIFPAAETQAIAIAGQRRSSRERQATPFFKEELEMPEADRTVKFNDMISAKDSSNGLQAKPAAGWRSVRDRIATPFASMDFDSSKDHRVRLAPASDVEEFEATAGAQLRPSRDRMPTPHVSPQMIEETFANFAKTVRIFPAAEVEATHVSGKRRSVRDRQATPFLQEQLASNDARTVSFNGAVSEEARALTAGSVATRSVRDRIATPFAAEASNFLEDRHVLLAPIVTAIEEFESEGFAAPLRASRDRIPTPHVSSDMIEEAFVNPGKTVRIFPAAEVEAVPTSGKRRPSRDRQATPFLKEQDIDSHFNELVGHEAGMEAGVEREISARVMLNAQRQAREERLVQVGNADANVPLALGRCSSAEGNPEADLQSHVVANAVKDTELLRNTLRNLAFFETFDDDALHCLIEAMEVYEFQPGEKVVRQGDTDGTHFFIVAQGDFYVIRDNSPRCYIGPGSSFGESVLLLHGERNATVCAQGCARAYGMEGMQVREMLRQQYEQMRHAVVEATDEVLRSNQCEILSGLNGYQLQSLYDQVEMKSFKPGDLILEEGDLPNEVFILCNGEVDSMSGGQQLGKVPRFYLMGDRALLFQGELAFAQPTSLMATTPVEVLVMKRSLLDNIFGSRLQQVLVRNRVLYVLAKHQDFSRLHHEHREAIASACQIRCLARGEEAKWEDVRVIVAVNGEFQLNLETGPQHMLGASSDLFCMNGEQQSALKLQAIADSKAAVWRREDLDSILPFNDFDGALEQDSKVRSLRAVFVFATLSKQQLQRLARALEIETVKCGCRVFSQGDQGTHFYIIRKGAVSVDIDGRQKRRLGHPDYFGERALLKDDIRSATISALEDTELWKMGKETFQDIMQGPCLHYLKDRISLQDTALTLKDIECIRVIGRGGFGVVKMVRAKKTGVRYALKCVRKRDVVEKNMQDALISELGILKEVDHPFIVKFVRSFRNERCVFFLTELVTGGELLDALDALGLLNHSQAVFYTGCVVLALEFLHSRRIAYLDLKSENCLIDQQGYLKLIDFGIARRITNTRYGPLKGTPVFMAPEMILGKGNSTVADLWSLGICLYEFVIGQFPFASTRSNRAQVFHQILRAPLRFPDWFHKQPVSEETMGLLRGLLSRDPKRRLGAGHEGYAKLKAHSFFKPLCWEKLLCRELEPPYVPTRERYAEDKCQSGSSSSEGKSLPTMEEEEVQIASADFGEAAGSFKRAVSAEGCSDKDANGKAAESQWRIRRSDKRRWTTSMGSIGGALTPACLVSHLEEADTPATSTVVSAAASEVASENSDTPSVSRRPSLRDGREIPKHAHRKTTRITFEGLEQLKALDRQVESDDDAEGEDVRRRAGSDTSSVGKKSDASSMNWRADALDVGENLAAEAAAKKGHTSVDSIVALVQAERERWEEERQALELRVEELQEQLRSMQAAGRPDAEKQALKREHQELRKVMKARSRFGAWVCERHMMESDDEETDAEKEELRRRISELSVKLRAAKMAVGAASSESDVSPTRRSPGPIIRRRQ